MNNPALNITIIGTGFVGVVSAAVYASFGHTVYGLDISQERIVSLKKGKVPFFEPGLEKLLLKQQKKGNLHFTTNYKEAIPPADIIIIAVGTPSAADGQADLRYVMSAGESLAPHIKKNTIVVIKSTVPPGTLTKLETVISQHTKTQFHTASLPEFLREGTAVADTLNPDRVVIGATNPTVIKRLKDLHDPLDAPILVMHPHSAQMAKYVANAYLATRITFANQVADLCERNGADIQEVVNAIGYDKRIGQHYWYPGFGYGGSCFPKDVKELAAYSRSVGEGNNLLNAVAQLNQERIPKLLEKYQEQVGGWDGKKIAVLGLSFKPQTDDTREAPASTVIPVLLSKGAVVTSYDPMATWQPSGNGQGIKPKYKQEKNINKACQDADVIMTLVEWPEIINFDFSQVKKAKKKQWFIDARNQFEPKKIKKIGFSCIGVGRRTRL